MCGFERERFFREEERIVVFSEVNEIKILFRGCWDGNWSLFCSMTGWALLGLLPDSRACIALSGGKNSNEKRFSVAPARERFGSCPSVSVFNRGSQRPNAFEAQSCVGILLSFKGLLWTFRCWQLCASAGFLKEDLNSLGSQTNWTFRWISVWPWGLQERRNTEWHKALLEFGF